MREFLEIHFQGWTATPRLPFVLSGNAICMATPSYSLLLGVIGCCLGRMVRPEETNIGFYYEFGSIAKDLETRQRLVFDGKKVKPHGKGSDAYSREFHIQPKLTLWLNRLDWETFFCFPKGTPSLGRSQDLLEIKQVRKVKAMQVETAVISGCMIPFNSNVKTSGRLVQIAEAFRENEEIGLGRTATISRIFMAVPYDNQSQIGYKNLYKTAEGKSFYFHNWD